MSTVFRTFQKSDRSIGRHCQHWLRWRNWDHFFCLFSALVMLRRAMHTYCNSYPFRLFLCFHQQDRFCYQTLTFCKLQTSTASRNVGKQGVRGLGEEEPMQGRVWGGWEGKATEDFDPSLRLGEEWRGEQGLRGKQAEGWSSGPPALVLRIGLLDLTLELKRENDQVALMPAWKNAKGKSWKSCSGAGEPDLVRRCGPRGNIQDSS